MNYPLAFLFAVLGYLIGALSFPRLVARVFSPKTDVTQVELKDESGNTLHPSAMGATTVSAALGWKAGCASSLLDMAKIFVPTLLLRLLYPDQPYFLITAFFGVIGNNWPIYYRFKGGWGVSAVYGSLLAVDPLGVLVSMIGSLIVGLLTRDFIALFLSSLLLLIPWAWFRTHDLTYVAYMVGVNLLFLLALVPEMKRYTQARKLAKIEDGSLAEQVPMGRGMIKMMNMLGMNKK